MRQERENTRSVRSSASVANRRDEPTPSARPRSARARGASSREQERHQCGEEARAEAQRKEREALAAKRAEEAS